MERIYEQSKDLHIASVIVYESAGHAYYDAECTKGVTPAELKDFFLKNVLVVSSGSILYRATGYNEAGAIYNDAIIAGVEEEV